MSRKDEKILELQYTVEALEDEIVYLKDVIHDKDLELYNMALDDEEESFLDQIRALKNRQPKYAGDVAFDFWPLRDWFRVSVKPWRPGQYFQVVIGPIRFEVYAA